MDQQQEQHLDQELRSNWNQVRTQILNQFAQVSTADLDAANNATDLIQRIAAKSHYPEHFVETRLTELVSTGSRGGQQQRFGSSQGSQQGQQGQQGNSQPYGQQNS